MNTNSLKHHQVMPSKQQQNENDVKKRKHEEVHHTLLSTNENYRSSKDHGIIKCCKNKSLKRFDDKHLEKFMKLSKSGKLFQFLLKLLILYFIILFVSLVFLSTFQIVN